MAAYYACAGDLKGNFMTVAVEQLKSQAGAVSDAERADLASFLIESLGPDEPADEAWRAEIARRIAAIQAGEVVGRPPEGVLARLRGMYP